MFFTFDDGVHGIEIWKSDGTAAGTGLVKDIAPGTVGGANFGASSQIVAAGSTLYFVGNDGVSGAELWKSDGTEAGTVMVRDIAPGAGTSAPYWLTVVGTTLFFTANEGANGQELWKSDGTAAGTVMVKNIAAGSAWSSPRDLANAGSVLYFSADDGTTGREMWRSDGTAEGTYRLTDLFPAQGSSDPKEFTFAGDRIYFVAGDGVMPRSLYYWPLGAQEPTRLSNLSTRGRALTGNDVLIGGFIVGGSSSKTVLVRARGPSLTAAGIANPLENPQLQLVRSADNQTIAVNDDWQSAGNSPAISSSGFAPSDVREAAILMTLAPGAYTAIMSGVGGGTGVGIVEIFEVDQPDVPLQNISTRGFVSAGEDVMIGGVIIQGSGPRSVVVRARGPSLAAAGIGNALANPQFALVRSSDNMVIAASDDWAAGPTSTMVAASAFAPSHPNEAAAVVTLDPGAYTVIVSGVGGTTGPAIVEVFRLN